MQALILECVLFFNTVSVAHGAKDDSCPDTVQRFQSTLLVVPARFCDVLLSFLLRHPGCTNWLGLRFCFFAQTADSGAGLRFKGLACFSPIKCLYALKLGFLRRCQLSVIWPAEAETELENIREHTKYEQWLTLRRWKNERRQESGAHRCIPVPLGAFRALLHR